MQKEQTKEAQTDWMHKPISEVKDLKFSLNGYTKLGTTVGDENSGKDFIKSFLNPILSGRINKDNVKNKYLEEIYNAKKLLDGAIVKKKQQKLDQN